MNNPKSTQLHKILLAALVFIVASTTFSACRRKYTPLPDGYFRIDPYPASYQRTSLLQPFISFEVSDSATVALRNDTSLLKNNVLWLDIRYPRYRATLYCSYHLLRNNLDQLLAESKELVYRQSIRPDAIRAGSYEDDQQKIYATLYELSAESATPIQFVATDSTRYLLRGALYFDEPGKSDSIAPVVDYLTQEIIHLIESIETPAR